MNSIEVLSIVIAISFGTFSIVGVMLSLFLWNRGESNSDRRNSSDSLNEVKKDIENVYKKFNRLERRKK